MSKLIALDGKTPRLGSRVLVADGAILVGDVEVGDDSSVFYNAVLHACTIDDNVMVGMGAIVMDGAHIKKNCIVGAGAIVTQGKEFPENSLVLGAPAHVVRELTTEEIEGVRGGVERYVEIKDKLLGA